MPVDPMHLESEPYSQYGNISAEGIQRLLGTPHLDALQVLIRETVQNSWDAGKDLPGSINYLIRFREISEGERTALREVVFGDLPAYDQEPDHSIRETLRADRVTAIEICDFGTTGLGGATNPRDVPQTDESSDFVDFIRNIGSQRDTPYGGGTYGYGKSCLYAFSHCRAIVVDSVTRVAGVSMRRLMACRVASRYDVRDGPEKGRYTGRHWWGRRLVDSRLEPASGADAESLSRALGMCSRGPEDLGTSILVLAPQLDCESLDDAARKAVRILLWYCWPKMVANNETSEPPMKFSVEVNGRSLSVPIPDECPPLDLFAKSLRKVREQRSEAVEIRSLRPGRHLGYLRIERGLRGSRLPGFSSGEDSLFPRVASHVALMRPAELVVKYEVGEPLPSDDVEWGGVFVCSDDPEVEHAFSAAEPPAHDDWDPQSLPKGHKKTFVNVALKRIRSEMSAVSAHLSASPTDEGVRSSLGPAADKLGQMLTGANGQRVGRRPDQARRRRQSGSKRKGVSVGRPVFVGYDIQDGRECALFEVGLLSSEPRQVLITGQVRILKEGGGADVNDAHGIEGKVIAWKNESGEEIAGSSARVNIDGEQKWFVRVTMPPGKAISLAFGVSEQS